MRTAAYVNLLLKTYSKRAVFAPFDQSLAKYIDLSQFPVTKERRKSVLKDIEKAVEALKAVPAEYHALVLSEATGKGRKKPGPKKGTKRKPGAKKPGPKPKAQAKKKEEKGPVKVSGAKLEKLKKLKAAVPAE